MKIAENLERNLTVANIRLIVKDEIYNVLKINDSSNNANKNNQLICKLSNCNKVIERERMHQHIGQHILNNHIIKSANVCGFCGMVGCKIDIITTSGYGNSRTLGPKSNCTHFYPFKLGPAAKMSKRSPCTNRPIRCEVNDCKQVYWSYCIIYHYQSMHPNLELGTLKESPFIPNEEKKAVLTLKF